MEMVNSQGGSLQVMQTGADSYKVTGKAGGGKLGAFTSEVSADKLKQLIVEGEYKLPKQPTEDAFIKNTENKGTNLDQLLDNPLSSITSPNMGPVRMINPGTLAAAQMADNFDFLVGKITGDEDKVQKATQGMGQAAKIWHPWLNFFNKEQK